MLKRDKSQRPPAWFMKLKNIEGNYSLRDLAKTLFNPETEEEAAKAIQRIRAALKARNVPFGTRTNKNLTRLIYAGKDLRKLAREVLC